MEEWDDLPTCLRPGQKDLSLRKTNFKSRAIKMKAERIPQNITSVGYAFLLQASKSTASNYCSFTSLLQLMSIDLMLDSQFVEVSNSRLYNEQLLCGMTQPDPKRPLAHVVSS